MGMFEALWWFSSLLNYFFIWLLSFTLISTLGCSVLMHKKLKRKGSSIVYFISSLYLFPGSVEALNYRLSHFPTVVIIFDLMKFCSEGY